MALRFDRLVRFARRFGQLRVGSKRGQLLGRCIHGLHAAPGAHDAHAFFPFADGLLAAAEAGATAVIQPGGSIRDEEVIAAANAAGIALISDAFMVLLSKSKQHADQHSATLRQF